uniref:Uncharacterized protein n=1 Tax=candidate division CPR3 bacterium TaxID=2268181 RepID=A0A7V3JAG5_UNCC3
MIYILTSLLIVYLLFKEWQTQKVIKDLTTKIMAKNLEEYLLLTSKSGSPEKTPISESDYLPIEESPIWEDKEKFEEAIRKK